MKQVETQIQYKEQFGNWIKDMYNWSFFITLTTRYGLSYRAIPNLMLRFYKEITVLYPNAKLFYAPEPCSDKYGYHIHGFIYFESIPNPEASIHFIKDTWRKVSRGRKEAYHSAVKPYDKTLGAHFYATKCIGMQDCEWHILPDLMLMN